MNADGPLVLVGDTGLAVAADLLAASPPPACLLKKASIAFLLSETDPNVGSAEGSSTGGLLFAFALPLVGNGTNALLGDFNPVPFCCTLAVSFATPLCRLGADDEHSSSCLDTIFTSPAKFVILSHLGKVGDWIGSGDEGIGEYPLNGMGNGDPFIESGLLSHLCA